jgi:transcriptional regulator with XRE-family HTH domain
MINRINLILQAKNITAKQFAEEIGIQPSGMSHILSGRNNPSLEFVSKVIRRYPEIDANWLLMGKGQMYGELGIKNEEFAPLRSQAVSPLEPGRGMRNEESLSEPTLFSAPLSEPAPLPEPREEPGKENYEPEIREAEDLPDLQDLVRAQREQEEEEREEAPEPVAKEKPAPITTDKRRLVKILFFYDDHTFEEYRPE